MSADYATATGFSVPSSFELARVTRFLCAGPVAIRSIGKHPELADIANQQRQRPTQHHRSGNPPKPARLMPFRPTHGTHSDSEHHKRQPNHPIRRLIHLIVVRSRWTPCNATRDQVRDCESGQSEEDQHRRPRIPQRPACANHRCKATPTTLRGASFWFTLLVVRYGSGTGWSVWIALVDRPRLARRGTSSVTEWRYCPG